MGHERESVEDKMQSSREPHYLPERRLEKIFVRLIFPVREPLAPLRSLSPSSYKPAAMANMYTVRTYIYWRATKQVNAFICPAGGL